MKEKKQKSEKKKPGFGERITDVPNPPVPNRARTEMKNEDTGAKCKESLRK